MPNALLDETRTERLPLNLPFLPQVRVSQTVRKLLEQEKPANESWADFAIVSMVLRILHARTVAMDLHRANSLLVTVLGIPSDKPASDMTSVPSYDERQKPTQMSLKTAMVAVGKRGRP